MNYQKIYNDLISKRQRILHEGYTEKHHIIPVCLGGTNNMQNLVNLTPEEHYLAHQLLVKIYPNNKKLIYAAHMMTLGPDYSRNNNKTYGWIRKQMSTSMSGAGNHMYGKILSEERKKLSGRSGEQNAFHGKQHTEETKQKISNANKGKLGLSGELNGMFGKTHTKETKQKISNNSPLKGTKGQGTHPSCGRTLSSEQKLHLSNVMTGRTHTSETIAKMKKPKGQQKVVTCPHCQKTGGISNMQRYHFKNCKEIL